MSLRPEALLHIRDVLLTKTLHLDLKITKQRKTNPQYWRGPRIPVHGTAVGPESSGLRTRQNLRRGSPSIGKRGMRLTGSRRRKKRSFRTRDWRVLSRGYRSQAAGWRPTLSNFPRCRKPSALTYGSS